MYNFKDDNTPYQKQIQDFAVDQGNKATYPITPLSDIEPLSEEEMRLGRKACEEEPLGYILMAGGMGSRLGFNKPKALYPISTLKNKPLLQLFLEHMVAQRRCVLQKTVLGILVEKSSIPLFELFLQENNFFGFPKENLHLMGQKTFPFEKEGSWFLETKNRIAAAPNGNGGLFESAGFETFLTSCNTLSIERTVVLPIDNPFLFPIPHALVGRHRFTEPDITCSAIPRDTSHQKMGCFAKGPEGAVIVDYPLLEKEECTDTFLFGNINLFCFSNRFMEMLTKIPFPYHSVIKNALHYDDISGETTQIDAIKKETFITDATLFSKKTAMYLSSPDIFIPIKTRDDVKRVQRGFFLRDAAFLEKSGVPCDTHVELHPRFYYKSTDEILAHFSSCAHVKGYFE